MLQDRKTGRLSQGRKRWAPLFKTETSDGKIITVAGQKIKDTTTDIKIEQLTNNGKETHEFGLPKNLMQDENLIENLKRVVIEILETKTLRFAKA